MQTKGGRIGMEGNGRRKVKEWRSFLSGGKGMERRDPERREKER